MKLELIYLLLHRDFVEEKLGNQYVAGRSLDFAVSFEEPGPATPMFFILSPGVDPLKDVEKHGRHVCVLVCTWSTSSFCSDFQGRESASLLTTGTFITCLWAKVRRSSLSRRWCSQPRKVTDRSLI